MTDGYHPTRVSLHRHSRLTAQQQIEVQAFVNDCQENRGFEYRFHWWCLKQRKLQTPYEYLCYLEGSLILYVSVYHFNPHELEICAAMSPAIAGDVTELYRQVLYQIQQDWKNYQISRFLLCTNQLDFHLIYAIHGLGAKFSHRDYELKLKLIPTAQEISTLSYKQADFSNLAQIVEIHCQCFSDVNREDYAAYLKSNLLDKERLVYLIFDQKECIGKLHFRLNDQSMLLHDFCVLPEHQNKGLGSKVLRDLLPHVMDVKNPNVMVEVAQGEERLLQFYRKNHFEVINVYNYFSFVFPLYVVD